MGFFKGSPCFQGCLAGHGGNFEVAKNWGGKGEALRRHIYDYAWFTSQHLATTSAFPEPQTPKPQPRSLET